MYDEKYELLNKWMRLQNKNISILKYLNTKGISKIIIYGASELALRLIEQCENEKCIEIIAISDKKVHSKDTYYKDILLVAMDDIVEINEENVYIIITAMGFYDEIAGELTEKGITNFISLRELVFDAIK